MIQIDDPTVLDKIISHLFKDKRKTPKHIFIDGDSVRIYWKNNEHTEIECMNYAKLKHSSFDGHLYIQINIIPTWSRKYKPTIIEFDIENDIVVDTLRI